MTSGSSAANIGDSTNVYKGLKVSDTPSANDGTLASSRVRRNSAGDSESAANYPGPVKQSSVTDSDRELRDSVRMAPSTASESFHDTSVTSVSTSDRPGSGAERRTDSASESLSRMSGGRQAGLIRPIPMCFSSENLPGLQGETSMPGQYQPPSDSQAYPHPPPFPASQIQPIRRFTTEADIHHATPLMLDTPSLAPAPPYLAPPYRAPPHPAPAHLYHPRDRLARPGPLLPPVDEDEYVALEDKEQDLHRQLLNLQSDGGSHDSHNDSGYSTRFGASAGPSPSLSGSNYI